MLTIKLIKWIANYKSLGDRAFKAMKSSFFCVIDYVNPLKEPTSCVKFVVKENEEWQKQQEASSSSSVKSNGKQQIQRSPSVAVSSTSRNVLSTNEVSAHNHMSVTGQGTQQRI